MKSDGHTLNILGFPTSTMTRERILAAVDSWIQNRSESRHLMALNPIKVCRARKEPRLARHILDADLVYPDAFGIAWAMRLQGLKNHKPVPGCDLMFDIMKIASAKALRVYLLGGSEEVVNKTASIFKTTYPGAVICGIHSGYFKDDSERVTTIASIVDAQPDIVFVAMGALIQEDWIEKIKAELRSRAAVIPLLMGVGGSFDAVTGSVARPPRWMLNLHLEWLFRLLQQPFRAPRMIALPMFAILTILKHWARLDLDYRVPTGARHTL